MGVTSAVTVFTQVTLPIKVYLKCECGWIGLFYIDDLLSGGYSYLEGLYWKFFSIDLVGRCGWVINIDKGQFPSQRAVYLGISVDTKKMMFALPRRR